MGSICLLCSFVGDTDYVDCNRTNLCVCVCLYLCGSRLNEPLNIISGYWHNIWLLDRDISFYHLFLAERMFTKRCVALNEVF